MSDIYHRAVMADKRDKQVFLGEALLIPYLLEHTLLSYW